MASMSAILAAVLATAAAADELPRYRLEPGMVLTYKGTERLEHTGPRGMIVVEESETTAWVVGRNPGGSVGVVMRHGSRTSFGRDGKEPAPNRKPMDYLFDRFDLFPDGQVGRASEIVSLKGPESLFPRLPEDRAQAEAGWFGSDEGGHGGTRYDALRAEPGGWTFRGADEGPEDRVSGSTGGSTFHFDAGRGLVARIESEHTIGFGTQGRGTGSEELISLETLDDRRLAAFVQAAGVYFNTVKTSNAAVRDERDPVKLEAVMASAKARDVEARDAMTEPAFRQALDRSIAQFEFSARRALDAARRRAEVVGKPAVGWKAPGLDGKEHALSDYRGKVVVLDFWYRGCVPCVKAMPQMNEVTEHFAGKPVAVLGMNTDGDAGDAKLVVDVMGLKYDTIRIHDDRELPGKYGVQGFPTVIVIDREGVVRDVHVGYSKDLREKLTKSIESLLPK